ncbi:MAG: Holliday junction branch migration protein RuvA [Parachlamydiaceae bacterium]
MLAFIRGTLVVATPLYCILEAYGVGYKLWIPASTFGQLPQTGQEALLHSAFIVRELSQTLYGFLTVQERDLFELLLTVTGVGPKMALSIIGHLSCHQLHQAISSGDSFVLSKIPGIGKKTSERLILEMRDKLKSLLPLDPSPLSIALPPQQAIADAMGALMHLGYTQSVAQKAVQRSVDELPEDTDLATLITAALKNI